MVMRTSQQKPLSTPEKPLSTPAKLFLMGLVSLDAAIWLLILCNGEEKTEPVEEEVTWERPVNANEEALAKSIFGDELNTSRVRQQFSTHYRRDRVLADAWNGQSIRYFGKNNVSDDYSKEYPKKFGIFVHEMTHIWQQQASPARACKQYYYRLAPELSFGNYCEEQQAAIVQDYALRFLHPQHGASRWYARWYGLDTQQSDALLKKMVEDRFPQAQKTRLALEGKPENIRQAYNERTNDRDDNDNNVTTINFGSFSMSSSGNVTIVVNGRVVTANGVPVSNQKTPSP